MPDILVRGMEMPSKGYKTVILHSNGSVYEPTSNELILNKIADATELPPHGDLIDMDKIRYTELYGGVEVTTANWIDSLPVVVPAERRDADA